MISAAASLTEDQWIEVLYNRFRIEVSQDRRPALHRAIGAYAQSIGEDPVSLLAKALRRQLSAENWSKIIHLATNHETRFFRNRAIIEQLCDYAETFARPRVLSVGCSTGEEPYSIAIALAERGLANFKVHGIDVSEDCIATASEGIYKASEAIPSRYVKEVTNGHLRFYDWLKDFVTFSQHNVMSDRPIGFTNPSVIVTQNMLIYYRKEARHRILEGLALGLPIGGYLITGPSEDAGWKPTDLQRLPVPTASVFKRTQ
tara:strand:+ start:11256 stop:12032 length:777 start_codon:yes stop_codon:yes gene_type:complete